MGRYPQIYLDHLSDALRIDYGETDLCFSEVFFAGKKDERQTCQRANLDEDQTDLINPIDLWPTLTIILR